METLKIQRKIDSTLLEIEELKNWLGKEVDIIIREKSRVSDSDIESAAGILSGFQDKKLINQEKNGWAKAARDKHGDR